MQRTVYDAALPAGARKRLRDEMLAAIAAQYPAAVVSLVVYKPEHGPRSYRVVAQLPKAKR